jgi:peroxiredoxin
MSNTTSLLLPAGVRAPAFTLPRSPQESTSLADVLGRPAVLCFYPADWSPVCSDQLVLYNELLPELQRHDASLLGVSVDGVWCHAAFARERRLRFPLLADFEPKGAVARAYGVYRQDLGVAARALFVLDGEGLVRWRYVSPMHVNPGADGILAALEALTGKESFA